MKAECSFTWEIKNFSTLSTKVGDCFTSPIFSGGAGDQKSFLLRLYPNGCQQLVKGNLSLYLRSLKKNSKDTPVRIQFALLNQNGEQVETTLRTTNHVFSKKARDWGYYQFIPRSKVMAPNSELLSNDTLKVRCRLRGPLADTVENPLIEDPKSDQKVLNSKLCKGFWQQYLEKEFVDVTVVVQEKVFEVHKAVLAAHSPVFTRMFKLDLQESRQNRVTIEDCDPYVFEAFVKWLYLGELEGTEQVHYELFALADKYAIYELKRVSEKSLIDAISVNNAIKTLRIADLHGAPLLKRRSLQFMKTRFLEISKTEDWPSLMNDAKLFEEVFLALASLVKNFIF